MLSRALLILYESDIVKISQYTILIKIMSKFRRYYHFRYCSFCRVCLIFFWLCFFFFRTLWTSATPVLCHTFSWMKRRKRPIVTVYVLLCELWLAMATILSHLTRKAVSVHLIMHQINLFISLLKNSTKKGT